MVLERGTSSSLIMKAFWSQNAELDASNSQVIGLDTRKTRCGVIASVKPLGW